MKRLLAVMALSLLLCFPAYADATPSDAEENPIYGYIEDLLKELDYDELDEYGKLELLDLYMSTLSGPGIASGSNADIANISAMLADIHSVIVPAPPEEAETADLLVDEDSISAMYDYSGFNIDRNVVIYVGSFNGQSCRLVLPASSAQTIWIDPDDNSIYNVGTSNITGRLFYGDADLTAYTQYVFTLTPGLANNASTLYNNGYPNYRRYYHLSSGRITSTDTYGQFTVTDVVRTPSDVPADINGYYLLCLILIGGVNVLCLLRKLRSS